MQKSKGEESFEEISFNKQCLQGQDQFDDKKEQKNKDSVQKNQNILQSLNKKIIELQRQLTSERQKSSQLQKRNQQLTDMLVSASQASVKRNEHFVKQVERKIANFRAVKDLECSTFRSTRETLPTQHKARMMTETSYQSTRNLQLTNRESSSSRIKFNSNKQNSNFINNEKTANLNQKLQGAKFKDQKLITLNYKQTQKEDPTDFQIQNYRKRKSSFKAKEESASIAGNFFGKAVNHKTLSQLQSKLMRV